MLKPWPLQDAKARFSELTQKALSEGPQHVTLRGRPSVVVLSETDFKRLSKNNKRPSFVEFFSKGPLKGVNLHLERSRDIGRAIRL
jgi:antitoxin Phd